MRRVLLTLIAWSLIVLPAAAIAAPPPDKDQGTAATHRTYPLTDTNNDGISDGLEAELADADPSDLWDVIATFSSEASAGRSAQSLPDQALQHRFALIPGFQANLNKGQITALSHGPGVVRVEENVTVHVTNNVNNDEFGTTVARADFSVDGTGVDICIADTGIDITHEQLDDLGKIGGWFDAISSLTTPYDDNGHGTHVAGTAAGSGTGGSDAAKYKGVAPGATIWGAKVLNSGGSGTLVQVVDGIEWCANQADVDIISMSLSTTAGSDGQDAISQAVNAAVDAGKIAVIAAGNSGDGEGTVGSPGAAEKAITVGAAADSIGSLGDPNQSNGIYLAPFSG
jgi:serine protease AprX